MQDAIIDITYPPYATISFSKLHFYSYSVKNSLTASSERGSLVRGVELLGAASSTTFACFLDLRTLVGFLGNTRRTLRMSGVVCSPGR